MFGGGLCFDFCLSFVVSVLQTNKPIQQTNLAYNMYTHSDGFKDVSNIELKEEMLDVANLKFNFQNDDDNNNNNNDNENDDIDEKKEKTVENKKTENVSNNNNNKKQQWWNEQPKHSFQQSNVHWVYQLMGTALLYASLRPDIAPCRECIQYFCNLTNNQLIYLRECAFIALSTIIGINSRPYFFFFGIFVCGFVCFVCFVILAHSNLICPCECDESIVVCVKLVTFH